MKASNTWKTRMHEDANADSPGLARIFFMLFWLVYLLAEKTYALKFLEWSLFHNYGIAHLIPDDLWQVLHSTGAMVFAKYVLILLSLWVALGLKFARQALLLFCVGISLYLAYTKGFGGHTNHQELTLLYCTYALALLPCFDSFSIYSGNKAAVASAELYRASMYILCLIVITQYVFIGLARTAIGFPGTFAPDVMETWLAQRALRPNPWGFRLVDLFAEHSFYRQLIPIFLPVSTILELIAPILLFLSYKRASVCIILYAGFHLSILGLMNIPFLENVAVLAIFLPLAAFGSWIRSRFKQTPHRVIVFFDGDCTLCHGFVQFVFKWETAENIYFAPLYGTTFQQVAKNNFPEDLKDIDSIIFHDETINQFYAYSDGVIQTLKSMGPLWHLPALAIQIIPRPLRDLAYRGVAAIRIRIFGQTKEACRLPTQKERPRMLG